MNCRNLFLMRWFDGSGNLDCGVGMINKVPQASSLRESQAAR